MTKREDNDANQLSKPLYTSKSGGAILMCAIVQCCWSEGLPNARKLNFGVGSIKKTKQAFYIFLVLRLFVYIDLTLIFSFISANITLVQDRCIGMHLNMFFQE